LSLSHIPLGIKRLRIGGDGRQLVSQPKRPRRVVAVGIDIKNVPDHAAIKIPVFVLAAADESAKTILCRLLYHRNGPVMNQLQSGEPITSDELDYLLPDIWLQSNPKHTWEIDQIRRSEKEAENV